MGRKPCRHGWWHQLRTRVAYTVLPRCERAAISYLTYQYKVAQLVADYATGPLHVKDQATAGLKDLGVHITGKEET